MAGGLDIFNSRLRPVPGSAEERVALREFPEPDPDNLDQFKRAVAARFEGGALLQRGLFVGGLGMLGDLLSVAGFAASRYFKRGPLGLFLLPVILDEMGTAVATTALNRPGGLTAGNYGKELVEGGIQRALLQSAFLFLGRPGVGAAPSALFRLFVKPLLMGGSLLFSSVISRWAGHEAFGEGANPFADRTLYGWLLEGLDTAMVVGIGKGRGRLLPLEEVGRRRVLFSGENGRLLAKAVEAEARLGDRDIGVRSAAMIALEKITPHLAEPDRLELALKVEARLGDGDRHVSIDAGSAIGQITPHLAEPDRLELALKVEARLWDRDREVCDVALWALHNITPHLAESDRLERALKVEALLGDRDGKVREAAVVTLGRITPHLAESDRLERALKVEACWWGGDSEMRGGVREALWEIAPHLEIPDPRVRRVIAVIGLGDLDTFYEHFHKWRGMGLVDWPLLDEVFSRSGLSGDISEEMKKTLQKDPSWIASPRSWQTLFSVLGDDGGRAALVSLLPGEPKGWEAVRHEDLTSVFSLLSGAGVGELQEFRTVPAEDWAGRVTQTRRSLQETASRLGLTGHPRYRAFEEAVSGQPGSDRLFAEWSLLGIEKAWANYETNRKDQKRLLNFLEANQRRTGPSWPRLYAKRMETIAEQRFVSLLEKDAGDPGAMRDFLGSDAGRRLKGSPLYSSLMRFSRFARPEGINALRRLILGLTVVGGKLTYPRYAELEGKGFQREFVERWSAGHRERVEITGRDLAAGQRAMKGQMLGQVRGHMASPVAKKPALAAIADLFQRVERWVASFGGTAELNGEYLKEAGELARIFELHYHRIRDVYGDTFANIRTDLQNYVHGMAKGVRQAKEREEFMVSGDLVTMARSGSEPVATCQTLDHAWENEDGQPINRMIHGQFQVANWEMDGQVVARRLLEVTLDDQKRPHLLVERLYSMGGFANVADFRDAISRYAIGLGIKEEYIHFSDGDSRWTAPSVLKTGDIIYRDTFRPEMDS